MNNKKILILGMVLIAIIIVLALLYLYYLPVAKEEEPTIRPSLESSNLYFILAVAGLENAVVEINPERTFVRYNLPENMDKEAVQYYIFGSAASVSPNSTKIVIQTYENFEPKEEVVVETKDVIAFMNESITLDEFKKRIIVKPLK